jgi:hypothetical protein
MHGNTKKKLDDMLFKESIFLYRCLFQMKLLEPIVIC